ncbi:MAG: sugar phosphate isomerase/epimerase family protein [Akkermansiaceae bacterium]|jgi:sugar phosphate isomerase/epimerase
MNDWPIGISTGCFYKTPIINILKGIRDGGFTILEICSFPDHLPYHDKDAVKQARDEINRLGLEAFSFHAPFASHIDITSLDEEQRHHALANLIAASEAAAILGARHIVIHPGPEREGKPPAEELYQRMKNGAEVLSIVATHCRKLGLQLLLENMLPHLLFGHTSDILYMLGAIKETNIGTCLDTGHANLSGEIYNVVHKMSGHLRMIHVNDNNGDWDAHLVPGEGSIDWNRIIHELTKSNFNGALILELAGSDGISPSEMLERARRGRQFIDDICHREAVLISSQDL